jgi:signal peptidase I
MAPTLLRGDRVLVDQRHDYVPEIDDVIVFQDPEEPGESLTKRVAAVGGQTIEIRNGFLFIDGEKWARRGQKPRRVPEYRHVNPLTLLPGNIYVLGDNVDNSEDSLAYGPIRLDAVRGRVRWVYWPPSRIDRIR